MTGGEYSAPKKAKKPKPGSFDRIRPVTGSAESGRGDPQGKQALFSGADNPPSLGSVALDCSKCHSRSVVSVAKYAKLSATGMHAPVPGRGYRAWLKCPACSTRAWVGVTIGR
jgi:hypothetical protein